MVNFKKTVLSPQNLLLLELSTLLVDEGVKNFLWSTTFGLSIFGVTEIIKNSTSSTLCRNKWQASLIVLNIVFPFVHNGVYYFQLAKNKNIIDQIAEEEESLVANIGKNNFFDKRESYFFAPNKKN